MKIKTLHHIIVCLSETDEALLFFKRSAIGEYMLWYNQIPDKEREAYYAKIYIVDHHERISIDKLYMICRQLSKVDRA